MLALRATMVVMAPTQSRVRRKRIILVLTAALFVLLIGGGVLLHALGDDNAPLLGTLVGAVGFIVTVIQLIISIQQGGRPTVPGDHLEHAAGRLAELVASQWQRESRIRSLHQPEPMQVHWHTTGRPLAADPDFVLAGTVGGRPLRIHFHGSLRDSAADFRLLPQRQLVVIGEPGSGKTVFALLLTLGLLDGRSADASIPVLLPVLTWDPTGEDLDAWLIRRIFEDYPDLRDDARYGPDAAQRLVLNRKILPILDGLDEMPRTLRGDAVSAITGAMGNRPVVVTCRTEEYAAAVREGGPLAMAAVIELEPVRASDAAAFLRTGTPSDAGRWRPIVERIRSDADSPIAQVLSSPLMVGLARTLYRAPGTNPAELLDPDHFGTALVIENHLLDGLIPAVYARRPPQPTIGRTTDRSRWPWDERRAERWLTYLAGHLDALRTRDFAWWELYRVIPASAARLVFVCFVGVAGLIVGTIIFGVTTNTRTGLVAGLAIGLACGVTAVTPVLFGHIPGRPVRFNIQIGRVGGLGEALRSTAAGGLAPGLVVAVITTLAVNIQTGLFVGVAAALVAGFVAGLVRWSLPADQVTAISPRTVLAADRRTVAVQASLAAVVLGLTIGLAFGYSHGVAKGAFLGATGGGALAFGFILGTAWSWYQATHLWLALRGKLPWRLMRFLDDAHARGVLRQAGSVYQFRHGRLQDRLAASVGVPRQRVPSGEQVKRELALLNGMLATVDSGDLPIAGNLGLETFARDELPTWREFERHRAAIREEIQAVVDALDPARGGGTARVDAQLRESMRSEVIEAIVRRTGADARLPHGA